MDDIEARALERSALELAGNYDERHRFTAADICTIHKNWLGEVYD